MHVFQMKSPKRKSRRGVSLLEVLVSIGVTSVGLLGVLALIPLGGAQTRQGQVAERCPVIGLSAFGEIRNRDMLAPALWVEADNTAPVASGLPETFCIDPLMVANGTTLMRFPAGATHSMHRLSLRSGATKMSLPMANAIFRSHDDLQLNVSQSDRTLPPTQNWLASTASADATRRQSEGTMSWMFMVQPNWAKLSPNDLYTVSVIVFNRRIIDPTLQTEFTTNVMDASTDFPGGGVAGGDVVLNFANIDQAREAKTPENSWLMLGGRKQIGTDGSGNPIYIRLYEWYRVLASDQTSATQRQVTLAGPDWDLGIEQVQATIIPGTMAVYQKNVQLSGGVSQSAGANLWRN